MGRRRFRSKDKDIKSDNDYDDVTVAIRISPRSTHRPNHATKLRLVGAATIVVDPPRTDASESYRLALEPGDIIVLSSTASAFHTNNLYLSDGITGDVLWSTGGQRANLGAVLIENRGIEQIQLALFGEHQVNVEEGAKAQWRCSAIKELYEQRGCRIIGLDDSVNDGDFNDISVTIIHFSKGRDRLVAANMFRYPKLTRID